MAADEFNIKKKFPAQTKRIEFNKNRRKMEQTINPQELTEQVVNNAENYDELLEAQTICGESIEKLEKLFYNY